MKSTKSEVRKRVYDVYRLRLGGAAFLDIREYADAPERNWGVSNTQLRRYISAADSLCEKFYNERAKHLRAQHLLRREQLYAHAMSSGDWKTALAVLADKAKLENLYPNAETELKKELDELRQLFDELTADGNSDTTKGDCRAAPADGGKAQRGDGSALEDPTGPGEDSD